MVASSTEETTEGNGPALLVLRQAVGSRDERKQRLWLERRLSCASLGAPTLSTPLAGPGDASAVCTADIPTLDEAREAVCCFVHLPMPNAQHQIESMFKTPSMCVCV